MPITEAAKAHLAKLAEQGVQAKPEAKPAPVEEVVVEETPAESEAEETPAEGE